VPLDAAQWILTVTLFAGAIAAPVLGRLGTGGRRRLTILVTLLLVAIGGLLTTIPATFFVLLIGRALQGLGLGVVALLMSVACDNLPAERAHATIAIVSVASTMGVGVAYPLLGLIDQLAGLRIAYGVGFLLSLATVIIAWRTLPDDPPRRPATVDIPGAVLLGIGTLGVLLAVAQPGVWSTPWIGTAVLLTAAFALGAWVWVERHSETPLVDLTLFMQGSVLRANATMLTAGVGMYLLFSLFTRYVQTPASASYGLGLSGVLAGATLIPFSVFGVVAGRLTPELTKRLTARWTYGVYAATILFAAILFAVAPDSLIVTLVSMSVLGFGVGGISAVMPRLVLDGVPQDETSSVLSMNQIMRSVGFSIGSALTGLLLAIATQQGTLLPTDHGYTAAALYALPLVIISSAVALIRRSPRPTD
jgi:predicted MFS family arabinose efflux permease